MGTMKGTQVSGNKPMPRRYSRIELLEIGRSGAVYIDITRFTADSLRSGVLKFKDLPQPTYIYPLSDVSVNRLHNHSVGSGLSMEEQVALSAIQGIQPVRQPQGAPTSDLAQRHAGFARFLKEHASPTHQRVTAGGRIVPMQPRQPPPAFGLLINNENHAGVNPASGPFAVAKGTQDHSRNPVSSPETVGFPYTDPQHVYTRQITSENSARRAINNLINGADPQMAATTDVNWKFARTQENSVTDPDGSVLSHLQPPDMIPQDFAGNHVYTPMLAHGQNLPNPIAWMNYPQPLVYPLSSNDSSVLSHVSPPLADSQDQSKSTLEGSYEDRLLNLRIQEQLAATGTIQGLDAPNEQYGTSRFPMLESSGPVTEVPGLSNNPAYQFPLPIASNPYLADVFSRIQPLGLGTSTALPDSNIVSSVTDTTNFDLDEAQRLQTQNLKYLRKQHARAKGHFNTFTKHLQEIDKYMAIHAHTLPPKVYAERIRERSKYVLGRAEARQEMHNVEKLLQLDNVPAVVEDPGRFQLNVSTTTSKNAPSTPLNVQAPPWTPKQATQSQISTDTSSHTLADDHCGPSTPVAMNAPPTYRQLNQQNLSQHLRHEQGPLPLHMPPFTTNGPQQFPFVQNGLSGQNIALMTVPPNRKIHTRGSTIIPDSEANFGHALSVASNPEVLKTNSNYEKLMDALRLPVGCVTTVNIIGNTSTMVHGQGLKQPPWQQMADHEREYWLRKPDVSFFLASDAVSATTPKQNVTGIRKAPKVSEDEQSKDNHYGHWYCNHQAESSYDSGKQKELPVLPSREDGFVPQTSVHPGNQTVNDKEVGEFQSQGHEISATAEKQGTQASKCLSSVATSAVTAHGQVPANDGGLESLRRTNIQSTSGGKSPTGSKSPMRRVRAVNDLRGIPFFRGFRDESDKDTLEKMKAGGPPF